MTVTWWDGQQWIGPVATLVAALVAVVGTFATIRAANAWDKRIREAVKTELEIAKTLKELDSDSGDWRRWVQHAAEVEEDLFYPGQRMLRRSIFIIVAGFVSSAVAAGVLSYLMDQYWDDFRTRIEVLRAVSGAVLGISMLGAYFGFVLFALAIARYFVSDWSKSLKRRRMKRRARRERLLRQSMPESVTGVRRDRDEDLTADLD